MTVIVAVALVATAAAFASPVTTAAQTIYVSPTGSYRTIQSALNAASAGDTIIVTAGTYYENVAVDKAVTLKAASGATVIVDAGKRYPAFRVHTNARIEGFTIRNGGPSYSGIYNSGRGATFVNNKISGCGWGIFVIGGGSSTISGNTVDSSTSVGICLRSSNGNTVTRNTVTNCARGLSVEGTSSGNSIYLNDFNNGYSVSGVTNTFNTPAAQTYTYHGKAYSGILGNRWANYQSTDLNGNGLGDKVYYGNGFRDNYPLMETQANFATGGSATPVPTVKPTVTPSPTARPTVTPVPTAKPTVTPVPTAKPTVTPVPTAKPTVTPTPTPVPSTSKVVGNCASRFGISPFPSADYWSNFDKAQQAKFSGSGAETIWVIGGVEQGGICWLNFPSSTSISNVRFQSTDDNEAFLTYFDSHNIKVYLQVEPGLADVNQVIKAVLNRYSKHPCVVGIGVDIEWCEAPNYAGGKPVTDAQAASWVTTTQSYNSGYTVALTHWQTSHMPPTYRKGLYFLYDGLGATSLADLTNYYAKWGQAYSGYPVGIYLGYTEDQKWWSTYSDPFYTCAQNMFSKVPNTRGVYWVCYHIKNIYSG